MKWALVLSGGAACGLSNAGVLEVLHERKLKPDCIAGSSMGAIIGGLYALGHLPSVFRLLAKQLSIVNSAKPSEQFLAGGLHGGLLRQNLRKHLEPLVGQATIGDCEIPFICIAGKVKKPIKWHKIIKEGFTDHLLESIEKHVFPPETPLLDAMLGSSAVPVVFSPVKIGKDEFIDLCDFGAVPSRTVREIYNPEVVIATKTTHNYDFLRSYLPKGWQEFMKAGNAFLAESLRAADLVLEPKLPYASFRFDKAQEFMEEGKKAAENSIIKIKKLLNG